MTQLGHNRSGGQVEFELRLFNSLCARSGRTSAGSRQVFPAGTSIAELLRSLEFPTSEVFLVLVNGQDITKELNAEVRTDYCIQDGDVVALSGPVPYSWGYGAPVV